MTENNPTITLVGNLTADPDLRFTAAGAAIATFTVASTPRVFDRQEGQWKDGEALFMRCSVWREAAVRVADTLSRGSRVIVTGRLKQRSFEARDGDRRTVIEVEVDEVGPSLRYTGATIDKTAKKASSSSHRRTNGAVAEDTWAAEPPPAYEDEPAF